MNDENGRVSFTTKELLQRLDEKLDRIDEKLDQKADRASVHDLRNRMSALELIAVNRDGPLISGFKAFEDVTNRRLSEMEKAAEVARLLGNQRENDRERGLSRMERYSVILSSVAAVAALVVSVLNYALHYAG